MIKSDGDYTVANTYGPPRWSSPVPTNQFCVFEQDYKQLAANWTPTAIGTAHPTLATYFLIKESDTQPQGPLVKWTRTYAIVPTSYSEFETYTYNFIGLVTAWPTGSVFQRGRHTSTVPSRIQNDFFYIAPGASPGSIAMLYAMQYCWQLTYGGVTYGGIWSPNDVLAPSISTTPTVPTTEQYIQMVADAYANGWSATPTFIAVKSQAIGSLPNEIVDAANTVYGGQIPVENSRLTRFLGPIWLRQTRYVLAE